MGLDGETHQPPSPEFNHPGEEEVRFTFFFIEKNNTFETNMYTQTKRVVQLLNPRDPGSPKLRMD